VIDEADPTPHGDARRSRGLDSRARLLEARARAALALGRLVPGSVARNFVVIGTATALGQVVAIIAAPVLARLYGPSEFGALSLYVAVLSIVVSVSQLRYDLAIPSADADDEATHLTSLSLVIGVVSSLLVGVAVVVLQALAPVGLEDNHLAGVLWVMPLAVLAASVSQALGSWAIQQRQFRRLGRARAAQGVGQAVAQIGLGIVGSGSIGLVVGDLVGRTLGIEQLARPAWRAIRQVPSSIASLAGVARRWAGFAGTMTLASLANALSLQLPFLMIPYLFGLAESGQYFLAYRVLVLPASLVGAAVSQVFFGEAAQRRQDPRRLRALALNATVALMVFSIPVYLMVVVAGPTVISAIFGAQWQMAGDFSRILAPWLMVWSVASPISALLLIGKRQRESLAFTVVGLAAQVAGLGFGAMVGSLTVGLIALSAISALLDVAALWRFLRVATVRLVELIRPASRIVLVTLPSLAISAVVIVQAPGWAVPVAAASTVVALGLAAKVSPEMRYLLSGSHD
jgi:O-antigen/teichoic acid export membrane protein